MKLREEDIMVSLYSLNSNTGGMHAGDIDRGVRLTHTPTGVHAQCSDFRSQLANKAAALQELESKVALHLYQEVSNEIRELTGE